MTSQNPLNESDASHPRSKAKYRFLDCAKGFAIISVVLEHLLAQAAVQEPWPESHVVMNSAVIGGIVRLCSVYELAVFFVVSGFLLAERDTEEAGFIRYFAKRVQKLLTVYLVFSFLYFFSDMTLKNIVLIATGFGMGVLWFLPTLAVAEAFYLLIRRLVCVKMLPAPRRGGAWLSAGISVALATGACLLGSVIPEPEGDSVSTGRRLIGGILILLLRGLVGQLFVFLGSVLNGQIRRVTGVRAVIAAAVCLVPGAVCSLRLPVADWRVMDMRAPVGWMLCASALSVGVILFFCGLEQLRFRIPLLEQVGRESLLIMCTHLNFGILPQCILLGYRFSAKIPAAEDFLFWTLTLFFLAAVETVLILIKRHAYRY